MKKKYAEYLLIKGRQDYDKISEQFSESRAFLWKELVSFAKYVKPGERILDLGCGNGRLYDLLKDKKIEYVGVDSSKELIKIAKSKHLEGNPKFHVVEALNLPFSNNYFDKVFSIAVLHHIPSNEFRMEFLKEIRRVLKPKGKIILTVWNLYSKKGVSLSLIKYTLLRLFGKSKLDKGDIFYPWRDFEGNIKAERYFHCFKKRELSKLVKKAGFLVEELDFLPRGKAKEANIYLVAVKS